MSALAPTLQAFFTDRLVRQRQVSPNTVQSYRDTLRLLLVFASERLGKALGRLDIDDLDAPIIGAFLNHLETDRKNGVRTRNARLAAVRSLFRYVALRHPENAATIERVLVIPRNASNDGWSGWACDPAACGPDCWASPCRGGDAPRPRSRGTSRRRTW